ILIDPWEPRNAMETAVEHGAAWTICVPTQLFSMVEIAKSGSWKGKLPFHAIATGGSAMTPELIADAEVLLGVKALRLFGMSECMGHASTRPSDTPGIRQNFDGLPFPGTEDDAFDGKLTRLPRGQRGEAGVRGPSLFLGYAHGLGHGQE